jgi:hypothetical protein
MTTPYKYGWYTDESVEKFCIIGEEPKDWRRGRTPGRTYDTPRKLARTLGFRKYKGKMCAEGHTLKYVSTGNCVECLY